MSPNSLLSFLAALICAAVAGFVLYRDRRAYVHRVFVVGMVALALEQAFLGISLRAVVSSDLLDWQRLRFIATGFVLPSWIVFSSIFARADYKEFVARWKWLFLAVFVFPLTLPTLFGDAFLLAEPELEGAVAHVIRLGWSGYLFHLFSLLCAVVILMNLERALRASTGSMRWRIKFMALGLAGLFAVRVYTASQALLFSAVDLDLDAVHSAALLVASALITVSLARTQLLQVDLYLSPMLVYNSLTVIVVGVYLLAVGIVAKLVSYVGGESALALNTFLVFLALLALAVFILSDELRQNARRLLYRHFQRPRYDYRKEWMTFTQRTTSLVEIKLVCGAVAKIVAETFGVSSVSIWLLDDPLIEAVAGGHSFGIHHEGSALKTVAPEDASVQGPVADPPEADPPCIVAGADPSSGGHEGREGKRVSATAEGRSLGVPPGSREVVLSERSESKERLALGGSTFFTEAQARDLKSAETGAPLLIGAMRGQLMPVDFDPSASGWAGDAEHARTDYFTEARIRYCAALTAGPEMLGLMTLNERVTKEPFSVEDFDLLKTIADQAAGTLLNLRLAERLARAKEMEAFQTMSAFFTHDLKNLASTLSLTLQNLSAHSGQPEFRRDAQRAISESVDKLDSLCGLLSVVSKRLELNPTEADLNELVAATVAGLKGSIKASLAQHLRPVARIVADPDQIRKVLLNLILNAAEAVENDGRIEIATEQRDGWAVLSVSDNGCGMSKEFLAHSLFRPLRTTKEQGLGIGLFQCKKIVEAHRGKIEVESEEGKGSTFRVMLPVRGKGG